MPGTMKTVFNNGGVPIATSADEFYQRQRLANQAQSSEDARLQADLQDRAAGRALQLQTMGSYADRQRDTLAGKQADYAQDTSMETLRSSNALALGRQGDVSSLERTNVAIAPQMGRLGLERKMYDDSRMDGQGMRDLLQETAGFKTDLIKRQRAGGNVMGDLFQDHGSVVAGPPTASGQMPRGPARASWITGMTQPGGGGSIADDQRFLARMQDPNFLMNEDKAAADAVRTKSEGDRFKLEQAAQLLKPLLESEDPAMQQEGVRLANELGLLPGGAPPAAKMTPLQQELREQASDAKIGPVATASRPFKTALEEINRVAREGSKEDVIKGADALFARLTAPAPEGFGITPPEAKRLIGEQLDQTLPGLGRDILSFIGDELSSPFRALGTLAGVYSGGAAPVRNPGAYNAIRNDLAKSGYLR